jgi:hypothetical protein
MPGRGYGFGLGDKGSTRRHQAMTGTPTPSPTPSAGFTMTQLAAHEAKRIYQRATTTGGGQGKGQGVIRIALTGASAGTVGARIRSDDGSTILQPEWIATSIANGAAFADVTGVDARLGWFYIDLRGSDGNWQLGTIKVGMGALFGFAGQSLSVRFFGRQDGQTATYASLGIAPDPNTAALATYNETTSYMPTVATMPWQTPGDVGNGNGPNAVGVGEFLNRMTALLGVNCGAFGHSQGGVALNTFLNGSGNWTQLSGIISRVGGAFEGFVWGQGHSDSAFGLPPKAYQSGLDAVFGQLTAANSFSGYARMVWTVPNIRSSTWGTPYAINRVRKGARDWCSANGGTYIHMHDVDQVDNIHESQMGSRTMGRHIARAFRAGYGASNGLGPAPVSAIRSGATITLTLSNVGQSALTLVGTPGNRIFVFTKGRVDRPANSDNRFPVSSVTTPNATTLSIVLANDPGDGHELDLYVYWGNGPVNGTTDNIYDNRDDDAVGIGRQVQANFDPIAIAAPTPGGAVNAPPGGFVANVSPFDMIETSATYGAGASGFGQELTGGTALAVTGKTPCFVPVTIEGFFTCPTIPGSGAVVLFGGFGATASWYVGIDQNGKVKAGSGTPTGATTLVAGKRYHVAAQFGPSGRSIYLTNITDAGAGVRDYNSTGPQTIATVPPIAGRFALRNQGGGSAPSGGAVDEWAVFNSERYSGTSYTCPTAPFTGAEADLVALYHCDGDTQDAVAS